MKNNIFKFNNKNLTEEEKRKRDKVKLILYLVFFVILILVVRFSNRNNIDNVDNNDDNIKETDEILTLLETLKNNNYEMNLNIIIDNDLINIVKRQDGLESEVFFITYRGEENKYFRYKDTYYILKDDELIKTNEYEKLFNYEDTFLDINNLTKLLEKGSYIDLEEESYNIRRYKISLNDALEIYNQIYNTKKFTSLSKEIEVDIRYKTSLKGIFMDITNFNNYIMNTEYNKVTYEISFTDINQVNLDNLILGVENL